MKFDYNRPFFGSYAREIPWTPAQILMWSGDTGFGGSRRDRAYQTPPRHLHDVADHPNLGFPPIFMIECMDNTRLKASHINSWLAIDASELHSYRLN